MLYHIALSDAFEPFDPDVHLRDDLFVAETGGIVIEHDNNEEGRYPIVKLTVKNTRAPLNDRWIHIARNGLCVFHGQISAAPRGRVDGLIDIEAIAAPPNATTLLGVLIDSVKGLYTYDPLFVPEGSESDPAEVLASDGRVVAWPRVAGAPVLCDPLSGSQSLTILPNRGTIDIRPGNLAPASAEVSVEAEWRQLVQQQVDLTGRIGDIRTFTSQSLVENWPPLGSTIGDAVVSRSDLRNIREETVTPTTAAPLGNLQYDPAWAEGGAVPIPAIAKTYRPRLVLRRQFEIRRVETVRFTVDAGVQPLLRSEEPAVMSFKLGDLAETPAARPWMPGKEYAMFDEAVYGRFIVQAREDHISGSVYDPTLWLVIGESGYIANRRTSSFFRTTRGARALRCALARAVARLRFQARTVEVSCQAALPTNLDALGHDTVATIVSPDLIGGSVTGRVVKYSIHLGRTEYVSLTIACCAGTGGTEVPDFGGFEGEVPQVAAWVDVAVRNSYDDQIEAVMASDTPPETEVVITPVAPPASDIVQESWAEVTAPLSLPQQVTLV